MTEAMTTTHTDCYAYSHAGVHGRMLSNAKSRSNTCGLRGGWFGPLRCLSHVRLDFTGKHLVAAVVAKCVQNFYRVGRQVVWKGEFVRLECVARRLRGRAGLGCNRLAFRARGGWARLASRK